MGQTHFWVEVVWCDVNALSIAWLCLKAFGRIWTLQQEQKQQKKNLPMTKEQKKINSRIKMFGMCVCMSRWERKNTGFILSQTDNKF